MIFQEKILLFYNVSTDQISYQLSEEYIAALYGFYYHIPSKTNKSPINTEFKTLHQSMLSNAPHISDDQLRVLKIRTENTNHKSNCANIPYRNRQMNTNLSTIQRSEYINKCQDMLNNDNFIKFH